MPEKASQKLVANVGHNKVRTTPPQTPARGHVGISGNEKRTRQRSLPSLSVSPQLRSCSSGPSLCSVMILAISTTELHFHFRRKIIVKTEFDKSRLLLSNFTACNQLLSTSRAGGRPVRAGRAGGVGVLAAEPEYSGRGTGMFLYGVSGQAAGAAAD